MKTDLDRIRIAAIIAQHTAYQHALKSILTTAIKSHPHHIAQLQAAALQVLDNKKAAT
jgi:predicted negative regulator of RcsB-dependent stress response